MTEVEKIIINKKEILLYRDIETGLYRFSKDAVEILLQALEEIQQYRAIGTIDEFKALKEKSEPKKPIDRIAYCDCPSCGEVDILGYPYCPICGQKLDWQ